MAKVMHLVDPKQWQRTDPMMNPIQRTISRLDEEMETILKRTDLTDSEKVTRYNQVLQRYLEYQDRPKQERPSTPKPKDIKDIEREVLMTIPKPLKRKAEALIYRVNEDPSVKWNERGELIYQGHIVPGSNMTDLIHDALRRRQTIEPQGWRDFARVLRQSNVPHDLIGHRQRWDWMHWESATSDAFSTADESPREEDEDDRGRSMLKTPRRSPSPSPKRNKRKHSPPEKKKIIAWDSTYK